MADDIGGEGRLSLPAEQVDETIKRLNAAGRRVYMEGQIVAPGHMVTLFYFTPRRYSWWQRLGARLWLWRARLDRQEA